MVEAAALVAARALNRPPHSPRRLQLPRHLQPRNPLQRRHLINPRKVAAGTVEDAALVAARAPNRRLSRPRHSPPQLLLQHDPRRRNRLQRRHLINPRKAVVVVDETVEVVAAKALNRPQPSPHRLLLQRDPRPRNPLHPLPRPRSRRHVVGKDRRPPLQLRNPRRLLPRRRVDDPLRNQRLRPLNLRLQVLINRAKAAAGMVEATVVAADAATAAPGADPPSRDKRPAIEEPSQIVRGLRRGALRASPFFVLNDRRLIPSIQHQFRPFNLMRRRAAESPQTP